MSDSDSPLSSPPDTEDEMFLDPPKPVIKEVTPPRRVAKKKEEPHEPTIADMAQVAFIIGFTYSFQASFKGTPTLGPQDLVAGVQSEKASEQVEHLLARLLTLCLNRKNNVVKGSHGRALEEALSHFKKDYPLSWGGFSPLPGSRKFDDLDPLQRLELLNALVLWSLQGSEEIRAVLNLNYKLSRKNDDSNVPIALKPIGYDAQKRQYYLIEGRDDAPFVLYRSTNPYAKNNQWIAIAFDIPQLKEFAYEIGKEKNKVCKELSSTLMAQIERLDALESKRKRRLYRQTRKAQFAQGSNPQFSYEGRTRGMKRRYDQSDEDEDGNPIDTPPLREGLRRSGRGSRTSPGQPEVGYTSSGRQIKRPNNGLYGEESASGYNSVSTDTRATAPARGSRRSPKINYDMDMNDDFDEGSSADDEADDDNEEDYEEDRASDNDSEDEMSSAELDNSESEIYGISDTERSHIMTLKYNPAGKVGEYIRGLKATGQPTFNTTPKKITLKIKSLKEIEERARAEAAKVNGAEHEEESNENSKTTTATTSPRPGPSPALMATTKDLPVITSTRPSVAPDSAATTNGTRRSPSPSGGPEFSSKLKAKRSVSPSSVASKKRSRSPEEATAEAPSPKKVHNEKMLHAESASALQTKRSVSPALSVVSRKRSRSPEEATAEAPTPKKIQRASSPLTSAKENTPHPASPSNNIISKNDINSAEMIETTKSNNNTVG